MLLQKIRALSKEVEKMAPHPGQEEWDAPALKHFNNSLLALFSDAAQQLSHLSAQVKARDELQRLLSTVRHENPQTRAMLWEEQIVFYRHLIEDAQACFEGEGDNYVSFSLTVLELLYLLRLLLEENVIRASALKPVFMFISQHAATMRQQQLSFGSLQKKYSTNNPGARSRVRELLIRMIARIDIHHKNSTDQGNRI